MRNAVGTTVVEKKRSRSVRIEMEANGTIHLAWMVRAGTIRFMEEEEMRDLESWLVGRSIRSHDLVLMRESSRYCGGILFK